MKKAFQLAVLVVFLTSTVLAGGQSAAPQPQQPTFRVQVDYVEVDVVVTDRQGNLVRDLKKEDFQVFEDGKPQSINTFTFVDIPIERADRPLFAASPIEPDVKTNERPFDGRIYRLTPKGHKGYKVPEVKLNDMDGLVDAIASPCSAG